MTISNHARMGLLLAAAILLLDQITKHLVLGYFLDNESAIRVTEVLPFFNLVLVWNRGVSFGLFNDDTFDGPHALIALAAVLVALVARWLWQTQDRREALAFGLIIGGAVGNVIDRVRFGAVVDFLDFHAFGYHWPAFNVADSAIVVGAGVILFLWAWGATTKE